MQHPINILERYWNYTAFRPQQEDAINAVIDGEDTFVLMPTGGGKSLCFQIPALAKEGICIVISPLIALMKHQVKTLNNMGIKALALTSGISHSDIDTLLDNCIYGNYKFLYLSPERLEQELVQDRIRQMNVNLIAVDEAHCISQWGNDFRPAYKNIYKLRELQPSANCIALTASATPLVIDDIIKALDFIKPKIFKQSFYRDNLAYMTYHEEDKFYKLERILKKYKEPSIVYVRNRKATIDISSFLESKGITSTFYHGGLPNSDKDNHLNAWLNDQKQVMVATNAFGMGIDKPDVKTVIHINLPDSLESYFQEAGRAGRNGDKAFAVTLKNKNDEDLVVNQFLKILPTVQFSKHIYRKLCNYFQISYGEGAFSTHDFNFNHFCKTYNTNALLTYNTLQLLDRNSIISLSKQFKRRTLIQFIISNKSLFNYLDTHESLNIVVKTILRTYGGVFENETAINTLRVADKASVSETYLFKVLQQLESDQIITLQASTTDAQVTFIQPREDDKTINRISKIIKQQSILKEKQVQAVLDYINNDNDCKSKQLLSYFGEENPANCGICSVCITQNKDDIKVDFKILKNEIIQLLEHRDLSSRDIAASLSYSEKDITQTLQTLLEYQIITITKTNTYKLAHI
ncbi:RecQ family ATP-dependent DNA helicase [Corallibacter sp.]|uniref:RecQ family ATP-dependent DNA helicase n=1 Tax=Corallibacter sp. TaxID=2038084 RepID=UPI003AB7F494